MQIFPPALRIAQSVAAITGADDALTAINTNLMSPDAIVAVQANHSLYMLQKASTAVADGTNVVAPAQGGPGRWVKYGPGMSYLQAVNVNHGAIAPFSVGAASGTVLGVLGSSTQVVVYNCLDSGGGDGALVVNPQISGINTVTWLFANCTATTIAAGTVALEVGILS